jgi:rhomboid protease GluP
LSIPVDEPAAESAKLSAVVFHGSQALCGEYSLVLEAGSIEHEIRQAEGGWLLSVTPELLSLAYDELEHYNAERRVPRRVAEAITVRPGATAGAAVYVLILVVTAYCTGRSLFDADWLSTGDLDAGTRNQWWRAITALTLHLDQEHLFGNVLFGSVAGIAVGRLLGPGLAWASILGAAALANYVEIFIAPAAHRAVGASTAVFAALGLLAGMAWRQRLTARERLWYRWAPLIAGICLLTLLGAGNARVDVLGHALGFLFGTAVGWTYTQLGVANNRGRRLQILTGAGAILVVCAAWLLALSHRILV